MSVMSTHAAHRLERTFFLTFDMLPTSETIIGSHKETQTQSLTT